VIRGASKCSLCPQHGRTKVASQVVVSGCGVALIGDAPGEVEEDRGRPFTGPTARLLNLALGRLNVQRASLWLTYVVACRPPQSDILTDEGQEAVACCAAGLKAELLAMRRSGIRVLVPMGQSAMDALGVEGNIATSRGSVFNVDGFFVIPTYDLGFLLNGGGTRRGGDSVNFIAAFQSDLQKALAVAKDGWIPLKEKFNIQPTLADVEQFVDRCIVDRCMVAVDLETTGLDARRGAKVVVIGLACSETEALVVPLLTTNGEPYWSPIKMIAVKGHLERLFAAGRLLFQNCFFDVPFLMNLGWAISIDNVLHDTMVVHSLVSPETPHNLGFIVSIYGQTPEWKEDFKNRSVPILQMDQLAMRTYNARDCVVLHQVIQPMLDQLKDYNLLDFYLTETRPLMRPFMQMTLEGVGFDFKHMGAFTRRIDELLAEKVKVIRETYHLPEGFNFDSDDELRWLLWRQRPGKFAKLSSVRVVYEKVLKGDKIKQADNLIVGYDTPDVPVDLLPDGNILSRTVVPTLDYKRAATKDYDELRSLSEVAAIPALYTLPAFRGLSTDGGKIKVSRDGLLSYRIALQNRLDTVMQLKTPRPDEETAIHDVLALLELLTAHSELSKLKTAFTSYMPHGDGRIRPGWMMHGTATGRLSCKAPNLCQLPSRGEGAEVRKFFAARPGWSIVDADKHLMFA